jgi:hypothetical protein
MTITLNIPEPVLRRLEATTSDLPRTILEGFAADAYRTGTLSRAEIGALLDHPSRWETEAFLANHDAWPAPSIAELKQDLDALRDLPLP